MGEHTNTRQFSLPKEESSVLEQKPMRMSISSHAPGAVVSCIIILYVAATSNTGCKLQPLVRAIHTQAVLTAS